MSFKNIFSAKAIAGAIGLTAALAAGSASAGINWGTPLTLFEDDDLDFLIQTGGETDGIIREGDILVAILEFNTANGVDITNDELTGIAVIEVIAFTDLDGVGGDNDIVFGPATDGFNAVTGLNVTGGGAGEGAMIAFWEDPSEDLVIDAGSILAGTESCQDLTTCINQASNGDDWLTLGFAADPDNFWVALNAETDTNIVAGAPLVNEFAAVNTALSILDNQTGQELILDSISCAPLCGAGNGLADFVAGGSVKGGGGGGQNGGEWTATSDFDAILARVPVPGTVALLGLGLLGLGATRRRQG